MRPLDLSTIRPAAKEFELKSITPYGNALAGDYPALFTGCFEAKYPKASRLIFGFTILNADRETPHDGPDGEGLYAVAVCNKSEGTNPKSKHFKIRKAMLQPEEFRDLALAINPPPPEHFTEPCGDRHRILDIRVERRETDGKQVSVVTHICRPRDAEWQGIEGQYEGARVERLLCEPEAACEPDAADKRDARLAEYPNEQCVEEASGAQDEHQLAAEDPDDPLETLAERPFWLREDGIADRGGRPVGGVVSSAEFQEFLLWNITTVQQLRKWCNAGGSLRILTRGELQALDDDDRTKYRIARRRAALGLPHFG